MIEASVMPRPAPPIFLRHGDAEPAGVGHRAVEILREAAVLVLLQPVFVVEAGAELRDAVLDGELVFGEGEIHGGSLRDGGAV
jgi:hypothetical protein